MLGVEAWAVRLAFALVVAIVLAGCLGPPTVRVALLTETFAFDENAPASAVDNLRLNGCGPGSYDPEQRRIILQPRPDGSDIIPNFVMLVHRTPGSPGPAGLADPMAGAYWPMSASSGGGFFGIGPVERWLSERGSTGGWGQGGPFRGGEHVRLEWGRDGAAFEGEPLREGSVVNRTLIHNVTEDNVTFTVTQAFTASYLGRLRYEYRDGCDNIT